MGNTTLNDKDLNPDATPVTVLEAVRSVLAAMLGVQSNKNRERDFRHGSARLYVGLGIAATLLFVLAVYSAVKLILALAAS